MDKSGITEETAEQISKLRVSADTYDHPGCSWHTWGDPRPDMSNSIAVPLVLLFLKVLPLPLIIAYVDLEQLVLQLILVSSNNY